MVLGCEGAVSPTNTSTNTGHDSPSGHMPDACSRWNMECGDIEEALMTFRRITVNSAQMRGVPCIRRLRMPVATVVGMAADGTTAEEILHP